MDDLVKLCIEQELRDCKTCIHSDKGHCAGTEKCHECMWDSKYEEQESSDNAIDRAVSLNAVKDLFCRICMESDLCYRSKETCEDLRLFDKLPPVDRWIPVKESLPKDAREVRVTDGTDVFIGWYDGTEWCSYSELFWPYSDPITAWMPYYPPKPYKPESEDGNE